MKMNRQFPEIQTFFGPLSKEAAAAYADIMRDENRLGDLLEQFLMHDIDARELAYGIQCLAESIEENLKGKNSEGDDRRSLAENTPSDNSILTLADRAIAKAEGK